MNNIQISDSEARSIRSLFNTHGWETYMTVMRNAREKGRDTWESSQREDKANILKGACLMLKELVNIEGKVRDILKDADN